MNNTNFIPLDKTLITDDNYYDICNPYIDRDIIPVLKNIGVYTQYLPHKQNKQKLLNIQTVSNALYERS